MELLYNSLLGKRKSKVVGLSFVSGNNNVNFKSSDINLGLGDFTVEIYARSEGSSYTSNPFLGFDKWNTATSVFKITTNSENNGLYWCPFVKTKDDGTNDNSVVYNYPDNTKNQHHIVITRQGTTIKTYINGVLKATKVQDRVLDFSNFVYSVANTSLFTLGRVFNFCATQSFVTELWNGGNVIGYKLGSEYKANCLLEYLPISIRTDKILDTSGNDNHGVFTGNPQKVTQSQINQGA